ncbi:Dbl homology domain-containing protein [Mycena rebaudengoi]|nr:Dbl homology domain-containing protein [Mycena rebaudengoi]
MDAPPPVPPPRSPLRPPPRPAPEPALSKRQHALHELLSSERAYASDLALGPRGPYPVCTWANDNLEDAMGSALDYPDATDDRIGELFLQFAPVLEAPYKQYITRHPSALAHLTALPTTPELTAYHARTRQVATSLSHAWDLASLLIKPVQRLLKYSLLLAAIIDTTHAEHPDRPSLLSAQVIKEVLSAPKKPPAILRIKSFRAPADVNSEAARVDRMAAELARIDVFAQQLSRSAQDWARGADVAARALLAWARAFAAAIGLSATVRSEAFDAFLATLTSALLPRSAALLPEVASDLLAPLARLLATAAQPRQLLASMAENAPLHHHLLTMPVSAKNRPPPALLTASAHYLALRVQLAAELPAYLSLLHRGLAALVRRLAAVQAAFFADTRDAWAGLWDMLRVEGERNGGGAETEAVWRARWGDVDQAMQMLAVCKPLAALALDAVLIQRQRHDARGGVRARARAR